MNQKWLKRTGIVSILSFYYFPGSVFANVYLANSLDFRKVATPFLANAFPTSPLEKNLKEFKVVPAYFQYIEERDVNTANARKSDISGGGAALSFVYGFNSYLGAGMLGAYEKGSGKANILVEQSGQSLQTFDGNITQQAYTFMANIIVDPFGKSKNFRLPIFAGIGYYSAWDERDSYQTINGIPYHANVKTSQKIMAPSFGLAPQFNTGKFRWTIFTSFMSGTQETSDPVLTDLSTHQQINNPNTVRYEDDASMVVAAGVEAQYRPWGLSFTISPSIGGKENGEMTFFSFKWTKKWGGNNESTEK